MGVWNRVHIVGCLIVVLSASACSTSSQQASNPLVAPPAFDSTTSYAAVYPQPQPIDLAALPATPDYIEPASGSGLETTDTRADYLKADATNLNCGIRDRFDRKALVAYHWGTHERSRLALDVDGLGFDGDIDEVRLEYSLRLQKEKPKKMGCRYSSQWQGMVGSGYNEMFRREGDDGARGDVRKIRSKVRSGWEDISGRLFD